MMNRKRINKFICLILVSIFLCCPVSFAKEKTLSELRKELKEFEAQKAAQEKAKKQTEAEKKQNENNKIKTEAEMEKTKEEIDTLNTQIEETNKEITKVKEESENILRLYQQLNSENIYASYITGASSMTDLVMRIDVINQLTDYNKEKLNELELLIKTNEKSSKELAKHESELDKKIIAYEEAVAKLDAEIAEMELGTLSIKDKIKSHSETIKEMESLHCDEDQTLTECKNPEIYYLLIYNTGWVRPVSKGRITSLYGYRVSPTAGASSNHKGIDIGIAEGTKVYGTAAGIVAGIVRKSSCGGNMVYIHTSVNGQPYTYVFMHLLEIKVKVGDVVTVNTVVGLSGGGSTSTRRGGYDRCTTGAHLHYGLAKGHVMPSNFNAHTMRPPGYPGLYQWFYNRY